MATDDAIAGLDELKAAMRELPLTIQKQYLLKAVRKGAVIVRDRASELAPRLTGQLAENMTMRASQPTAAEVTVEVGPDRASFYGSFSEFGTVHQAARPFLRPAYDEKLDEAQAAIIDELREAIEKEGNKA